LIFTIEFNSIGNAVRSIERFILAESKNISKSRPSEQSGDLVPISLVAKGITFHSLLDVTSTDIYIMMGNIVSPNVYETYCALEE